MSIAEKLTYLQTTKQLLKTEINKINNVLDDNSTFRSYPQELFNGYLDILNNGTDTLWNNLEKVSQTGTEAVLEDVETAPMKMVLSGNTSQDTTSGKNLFDKDVERKNAFSTGSVGQVVGYGNSSASYSYVNCAKLEANKTYTLSWVTEGTKGATTNRNSKIVDDNNIVLEEFATWINNVSKITFTPSNDGYLVLTTDISSTNIQLELGSTATSPYEPYTGGQPSPSPDFPQEVKVVKGENVVSVSGKNLLDTSNARNDKTWLTRNSDGSLTLNYPSGSNVNFTDLFENNINMPTDNYILKIFMEGTFVGGNLIVKNTNGNYIGQTPIRNGNAITITNSDIGNIQFYVVSAGTNCTIKLELEKETPTSYVPYSKTDYPINLVSKNLFSTENLVNATITDTGEYLTGDNRCTGDYVFLDKSQENLALSFNLNILFMGIAFYDENKQYLSRATINNTNLLTAPIPTNAEYCRPFFQFTTSPAAKIDAKIVQQLGTQLEYGTERTNYVSYFTPIELCKINTYKDYFHKDSGKWYVHKEINKVVLDGTERGWNLNYTSTQKNIIRYAIDNLLAPDIKNSSGEKLVISNYFKGVSSNETNSNVVSEPCISGRNVRGLHICVYLNDSNMNTLELFKTWLSTHNTIVYYVLATPTETEITNTTLIEQLEAISKAKSVKDKTYITQTNEELPFILDVEAIKEYEVN